MKMPNPILTSIADRVAWVRINRPEKLNALNSALLNALHKTFSELQQQDEVRVVVLMGAGEKAFVAGADISEFAEFTPEQAHTLVAQGQEKVFDFIENLGKPVIAAINGFALGGGLELAMACHLRIAADHAKMALPEVSLGVIPGYGGTQRLPQLVGKGRALEMILTGGMISAQQAFDFGLVNRVVAADQLLTEVAKMASQLLKNAPSAQAAALRAVKAGYDPSQSGYAVEKELFADCFSTADFKEGTQAFLNKRKANF
jgi:enoyl-CoA hydratase